jgi:ABC-type hemin transport system ATPase subunit
MTRSSTKVCMSTRQLAYAKVSDAEIATLTPGETARLHLAEVLGQVEACPWWAG